MLLTVTQSSYKYVYLQKLHNYISFMEIQHSYQANLRMKQQKEIVQFCTCRHGQNVQQYSQGVEQGGELNSTIQTVSSLETTCLRICAMRTAMSLLCLKIISHQAPIYLSELLHLYTAAPLFYGHPSVQNTILPNKVLWSALFLIPGSSYLEPTPCFCPPFYLCQLF